MSEMMMEARSLHRRFGGLRAVSDVSLAIYRNEVHAVIGPNGAGKSTLINLLSGDVPVSEGEVRLGDREITGLKPNL
ncbi:MAG: ATP-binding cassette domain-containing protein, partial [Methylobacterium sp.]|nr:ATP-binding cassette domain-containing protein [Methylobacterium sp.]